jgi:hypothetical protein
MPIISLKFQDIYIPKFMQKNPSSEANSRTATQVTPCILWNLNVESSPLQDPILETDETSLNLPILFLQGPFNIILPTTSTSSKLYSPSDLKRSKLCANFPYCL